MVILDGGERVGFSSLFMVKEESVRTLWFWVKSISLTFKNPFFEYLNKNPKNDKKQIRDYCKLIKLRSVNKILGEYNNLALTYYKGSEIHLGSPSN